ncbi:JmjC domain-containing protein [Heracleum sosnowskyi]|uniref:JmjC domain-containing protein n=1 Tax=Heracleum sosnowskyi TaxID=360622 RepID=A0AAD8MVZ2_9APIA|nr:JmjC domain-containing protein [Heracleum sosnowskyi]
MGIEREDNGGVGLERGGELMEGEEVVVKICEGDGDVEGEDLLKKLKGCRESGDQDCELGGKGEENGEVLREFGDLGEKGESFDQENDKGCLDFVEKGEVLGEFGDLGEKGESFVQENEKGLDLERGIEGIGFEKKDVDLVDEKCDEVKDGMVCSDDQKVEIEETGVIERDVDEKKVNLEESGTRRNLRQRKVVQKDLYMECLDEYLRGEEEAKSRKRRRKSSVKKEGEENNGGLERCGLMEGEEVVQENYSVKGVKREREFADEKGGKSSDNVKGVRRKRGRPKKLNKGLADVGNQDDDMGEKGEETGEIVREIGDLGEKGKSFIQEKGKGDLDSDKQREEPNFVKLNVDLDNVGEGISNGSDVSENVGIGSIDDQNIEIKEENGLTERKSIEEKKANLDESVTRRNLRQKKVVYQDPYDECLEEYFKEEDAAKSQKRRRKSSIKRNDEENCKTKSRGPEKKESDAISAVCKSDDAVQKPKRGPKSKVDDNGEPLSNMCHQCQRNDKGRVVKCRNCKWKRYCVPCMTTWYPKMTEEDFAKLCPVCQVNCNCKRCLRLEVLKKDKEKFDLKFTDEEKIQYSKYIIPMLLPFLKQFNEEQMNEKQIEANIRGLSLSDLEVKKAKCGLGERMYCDSCRTSIADFHRSCMLELKCLLKDAVSSLVLEAEKLSEKYNLLPVTTGHQCSCFDSVSEIGTEKTNLLKAASRKDRSDNYLLVRGRC